MQTLVEQFSIEPYSHSKAAPAERAISVTSGALLLLPVVGKRSALRWTAAAAGGALIYYGLSGAHVASHLVPVNPAAAKHTTRQSITIAKPAAELFTMWRNPDVLARVKPRFTELTAFGPDHLRWTINLPVGSLEIEAILVEERPAELVHWRSTSASTLQVDERMRFRPAPRQMGTEATLEYQIDFSRVPAGRTLRAIADFFDRAPQVTLRKVLENFKSLAETGEIPTLERNPSARADKHDGKGDLI
jgi:uncharacterized membrane protein